MALASRPCITRKMRVSRIILFLLRAVSYIRIRKFIFSPQLPKATVDAVRPKFLSYVHIDRTDELTRVSS